MPRRSTSCATANMSGSTRSGFTQRTKGTSSPRSSRTSSPPLRGIRFHRRPAQRGRLDLISAGQLAWKDVLRDFWRDFIAAVQENGELRITEVLDALNDMLGPHIFPGESFRGGDPRACLLERAGASASRSASSALFIGCSNYPDCRFTVSSPTAATRPARSAAKASCLGTDPETELDVTLRTGRFGPYVQLGENGEGEAEACLELQRVSIRRVSILRARSHCCRCRAKLASVPRAANPSPRALAASSLMCSTDGKPERRR